MRPSSRPALRGLQRFWSHSGSKPGCFLASLIRAFDGHFKGSGPTQRLKAGRNPAQLHKPASIIGILVEDGKIPPRSVVGDVSRRRVEAGWRAVRGQWPWQICALLGGCVILQRQTQRQQRWMRFLPADPAGRSVVPSSIPSWLRFAFQHAGDHRRFNDTRAHRVDADASSGIFERRALSARARRAWRRDTRRDQRCRRARRARSS